MLINRLHPFSVYMNEAGNEGSDGGGGTPPPAKTPENTGPTADQIQAQIDKAVADAVAANNAERDKSEKALKENKDSILEQLKQNKEKQRDLELKQRMIDGDVEKVTKEIEARIKKENAEKMSEYEKQIETLTTSSHNKNIESVVDAINDGCNIKSDLRNARKLEILHSSEITTDENGNILIDGKNQDEFISDWLENGQNVDTWKAAKPSSGGGSKGGKSQGGALNNAETTFEVIGRRYVRGRFGNAK